MSKGIYDGDHHEQKQTKRFQTFLKSTDFLYFWKRSEEGRHRVKCWIISAWKNRKKLLFLAIVTGETWKKLRRGLITKMMIDVPGTGGIIHCAA